MPRLLCAKCSYPKTACVCPWVSEITSPVEIMILQHYRERGHAKNTTRLVRLAIPAVDVRVAKAHCNLQQAADLQDGEQCAVFFPIAGSRSLEQHLPAFSAKQYQRIVFLDGSWKQASGMAHSLAGNPGIHFYHFDHPQPSRYQIRHTRRTSALSTIEAIALALEKAYSVDSQPLMELLQGFQNHWRGPVCQRRRS